MRTSVVLAVAACLVCIGTGVIALAQVRPLPEGSRPYTPTRLEWLAVDLNAQMRVDVTRENGYMMTFVPIENEDALLIYVRYAPSADRRAMNLDIDTARKVISSESKSRGWSSWLKVKERIELDEPK